MTKKIDTVNRLFSQAFVKKISLGHIATSGLFMAIAVSFSLSSLAQNLPSDNNRINEGFFGDNSTNASERFFEQGEYQIEQEVIELEQDPTDSEDDQILEVDPEVTDDNEEIQSESD